ncbi:MAG: response regulator [Chloroflexi bacterium]|nr:response regulator [Chloroflexota bacterium]MBK7919500.1 response regulator [Chloroflexota bacterium]MBP6802911.1 response regulator [Chloroflexota bacterium]MBP7589977.1 response regulator [Chloroflexota bacterium]
MYERVLVIDDSEEIREFLSEYILRPKGFEVLTASNGLMGLEMAIAKEPNLMIVDQQMPRLTGLEVLEKLKERGIEIPAILATAHGSEETAVAAFRLGIRDYVIKPFDADEISESVDKALRESRLARERDQLVQQLMESNSQLQRRAQELNVLYGVGKSVASSLDLEEVLHRVVEAAVYVVGAEEGSLMLLDEDQGELYIRASKNLDSKAQSMRKRVSDSLAGKVLQTKRAIAIGNDSQWKRTHTALLVKSLIYVPLILQNKPIGVLGVTNRLKETSFDSNDTRALSALGGYATIAINNANIYSEIEREKNTLSAVMDLSDNPILVIDENNRLLLTNSAARKHLGFVSGENPIGQPIQDILQDDLLAFIDQPQGTARQIAQKLVTASGQTFKAEMTLIEGGNRSILLQPAG